MGPSFAIRAIAASDEVPDALSDFLPHSISHLILPDGISYPFSIYVGEVSDLPGELLQIRRIGPGRAVHCVPLGLAPARGRPVPLPPHRKPDESADNEVAHQVSVAGADSFSYDEEADKVSHKVSITGALVLPDHQVSHGLQVPDDVSEPLSYEVSVKVSHE